MTPLLPCHGPFFIAAAATCIILRHAPSSSVRRASRVEHSQYRSEHSPRRPARVPRNRRKHARPLDILAAIIREEPARGRARAVPSMNRVEHDVVRVRVRVPDPVRRRDRRVRVLALARRLREVRREREEEPVRTRTASARRVRCNTYHTTQADGGTHPVVTEFRLSSSAVGRQNTAPAFVTPLQLPWMPKFFTDVLPEDACALVIWLQPRWAHVSFWSSRCRCR